jgi:FHA domain/PilZ domain
MATPGELDAPRWQLRVLDGPLRGSIHLLGDRLSIGRAGSSDLQILHDAVSRQHAHVARDAEGHHVLVDLVSSNGTFVDGRRVERLVLRPHAVVSIADTQLVYEPTDPHGPTTQVRWGHELHPLSFLGPDGVEHGGRLLDEILEYRTLRAQARRSDLPHPAQQAHFEALEAHLRQPQGPRVPQAPDHSEAATRVHPGDERRAFGRYACWFPATLRLAAGQERPCSVHDMGVDGAQLAVESEGLEHDEFVWLSISLEGTGQPRDEVLTGRVAWIDRDTVGLAFAGAPRSERHRAAAGSREALFEDAPTMRLTVHPATLRFERLLAQGRQAGPS